MKANREQILCHCLSLADLNDLILQLLANDFFSSGHLKVKSRDMRTLVKSYLLPYFNIQFQKNFQNKNYKISSYIPLVTIAVTQNALKQQAIYLWYVIYIKNSPLLWSGQGLLFLYSNKEMKATRASMF